jgi:hypothetical protein
MADYEFSDCYRAGSRQSGRTCIEDLAEGWTGTVGDLCSSCTSRFMQALDARVGPLTWHQGLLEARRGDG